MARGGSKGGEAGWGTTEGRIESSEGPEEGATVDYQPSIRQSPTHIATGWDAPMTTVSGLRSERISRDSMKFPAPTISDPLPSRTSPSYSPVSSAPLGGLTSSISTCTSYRRSSCILSLGSGTSAWGIGRSRDLALQFNLRISRFSRSIRPTHKSAIPPAPPCRLCPMTTRTRRRPRLRRPLTREPGTQVGPVGGRARR